MRRRLHLSASTANRPDLPRFGATRQRDRSWHRTVGNASDFEISRRASNLRESSLLPVANRLQRLRAPYLNYQRGGVRMATAREIEAAQMRRQEGTALPPFGKPHGNLRIIEILEGKPV